MIDMIAFNDFSAVEQSNSDINGFIWTCYEAAVFGFNIYCKLTLVSRVS